jgi:hypothetical protein
MSAPQINFRGVGFEFLLPIFQRRRFAGAWQRRISVLQKRAADVGGRGGVGVHHA